MPEAREDGGGRRREGEGARACQDGIRARAPTFELEAVNLEAAPIPCPPSTALVRVPGPARFLGDVLPLISEGYVRQHRTGKLCGNLCGKGGRRRRRRRTV